MTEKANFDKYMLLCQIAPDGDKDFALAIYKKYIGNMTSEQYDKHLKRWIKENKTPIIYSMFTFTTDPNHKDLEAQEAYICSILKRKENLNIKKLYYTKEHWDTNPHFHVVIGSTRSIPCDVFKSYKKFGYIKKSKLESENDQGLQDYLNKENKPICLL